jgi:hypothetical protein
MKWVKETEEKLILLYADTPNYELIKIFNISEKTLTSKAYRLKLKKSKSCKSFLIGKRNKMVGRDLNYDTLKKIASNYRTRGEFQLKDSSAYSSARIMGVLDDICSHMILKSFSIPQLTMRKILNSLILTKSIYNDKKSLKPFEIDLYYPELKLGFEYNGKGWHVDNRRDIEKNKLAICNGITLITFIENNRKYESDIKEQLKKILPTINNIITNKISTEDIDNIEVGNVYLEVYNKEELYSIAKTFNSKKEFRNENLSVYNKLYRMGLLNDATKHFSKKNR